MERIDPVLDFWFGNMPASGEIPKDRFALWFSKNDETDSQIKKQFHSDMKNAQAGEYQRWQETPNGSLALIILLDQFSRNVFRNTPLAFGTDPQARTVAHHMVDSKLDKQLKLIERVFVYLPFEHAEDLALQEKSVQLYKDLETQAPEAMKGAAKGFTDYAVKHHEIIRDFGRFPHRNQILGRESTKTEIEFLKQPGSSF